MSVPEHLPADQFVQRFREDLIPLNSKIRWFSVAPLPEEDVNLSVRDPLESLPPKLAQQLPHLHLFLVPFLKSGGKKPDLISFVKPEANDRSDSFQIVGPDSAALLVATQDLSPNEYHYSLFNAISSLSWEVAPTELRQSWVKSLKDELRRNVHGEIDEISWQRKNDVLAKQSQPTRDSKLLRDYLRASYIDTMTLFLHGICCDIDVEPSPRQIPSNEIRRRLDLLRGFYPLGEGYALFPDELGTRRPVRDERQRSANPELKETSPAALESVRPERGEEQEKNQEK